MIQLRSILIPADNAGAKRLRVIHIENGSKRKYGYLGDRVTCVVDKASPTGLVKDSQVVKAVLVRVHKEHGRADGSYIRFDDNAGVVIDPKTGEPIGTRVFGPIAREVKDRGYSKIASLATEVL